MLSLWHLQGIRCMFYVIRETAENIWADCYYSYFHDTLFTMHGQNTEAEAHLEPFGHIWWNFFCNNS